MSGTFNTALARDDRLVMPEQPNELTRLRAELAASVPRIEFLDVVAQRNKFAAELAQVKAGMVSYEELRAVRFEASTLKSELAQAKADADKLNDEVQVEIGFKLAAHEELEKAKADVARLREALQSVKSCSGSNSYPRAVADEALAAAPAPVVPPPSTSTYPLFEHMSREHGLTLVESELREIIDAVERCGAPVAQSCDAR